MKPARIAIVVLHYKNPDDTRECLVSLQKIEYPLSNLPFSKGETQRGFSVIVINNDSVEHARILQDEFGDFIQLVQNKENLGFAEGNNVGIRAALEDKRTDAVLILNNDTIVEKNFLSELVLPLTKGEPEGVADMVAPRLMQFGNRDKIDNLGIVLMTSGLPFNRLSENEKLFCPSGGAALYSRKLLEKTSFVKNRQNCFFDPLFFAYCEDLDLGWRARLAGFQPGFASKAIAYHKGSAATAKLSDFAVYHTYRNLLWTQFKNFSLPLLLWQSPWLGAGWFFIFILYTLKGRPKVIIKASLDGVLGLQFIWTRRAIIKKSIKTTNKEILSWFVTGLFPKKFLKL